MSAPLPAEEAQRLDALHRYEVLDTSPEVAFDRITTLAARLFAVPVALVTLLDADRQWFKSASGLDICETSRDVAFCNYTILGDTVLVVPDATLDARFAENPLVSGPSHLRFYAGAPLCTADGHRLGSLCLIDTRPRPAGLDAAGRATLADLAAMVVDELELRLASRRARGVERERQRKEAQIAAYARQQSAIARFGQRALESAESGLNALLTEAADLVATTLGADFSTVFEHLSGHGILIRRAGYGWPEEAFNRLETGVATNRETAPGCAFLTGRAVVSTDTHRETRFKLSPYAQQHGAVAIANVIIARAAASGGGPAPAPFGVLNVLFRRPHDFSGEEVAFLQAIANVLATAIARQRAETTIQHAREEAERANEAKSEFLSRMSHELRTPMNAILGFGQLLEMDELSERQMESVSHILAAGRHLLNLINEVLDTERIESGRLELNMEPVAVQGAVGEVLALIKPTAASRGVTFKDQVEGEVRMVLADRQRLRQVLINLLSNAVKYNRENGTVEITCTGVPTDAEDGAVARVRLTVRDSGPGITPENLGRLFTPFERLDAAHRRIEGTGIGLALSKRLTEAMGGRIGVESAVGWGSAFFVELPLASAVADLTPAPEEGTAEAADPPEGEEARTVLYVEDNPANLRLVEHLLTHRPGLRLLSAQEGVAGLELARRWQPDLILLDLHLPDLPGDVILRALRADERTGAIPVIILSADSAASQVKRLRAAGANDYLTKPLQVPEFLRVLDDRLGVLAAG